MKSASHGTPSPSPDEAPVFQLMRERRYGRLLDQPPECTLFALRRSLHRSQQQVADGLGVRQLAVSRLERRGDPLLSSLRGYVSALGGQLQLIVRLPDRAVRLRI